MAKDITKKVDALLKGIPAKLTKAQMASMPDLVAAIDHFLDLKLDGDPRAHVSFAWFYKNKLREAFDGPCVDSARNYIREIMRRNPSTGERLDG